MRVDQEEARERFQSSADCWDGDELENLAVVDEVRSLILGPDGKPYPAPAVREAFTCSIDYSYAISVIRRPTGLAALWARIRWKWELLKDRWYYLWHDEPEGDCFWSQEVEDDVRAQLEAAVLEQLKRQHQDTMRSLFPPGPGWDGLVSPWNKMSPAQREDESPPR